MHYMHKHGYFHRDMKPENVLINNGSIKIADFGLAREVRSRPPYTEYVSTRWYRSPELLLRSPTYNSPVDIWACGTIVIEMFCSKPLFAGDSEMDMLMKIFTALGPPNKGNWENGVKLLQRRGVTSLPPKTLGIHAVVEKLAPKVKIPPSAIDLALKCMIMNPLKRITAPAALTHPFCQNTKTVISTKESVGKEEAPLLCTTVAAPSPDKKTAEEENSDPLEETINVDELMEMLEEVEKSRIK